MILTILDIIGIISFSLSGYIISTKANYDILGVFLITYISALGGGLVRDVILNLKPFIFDNSYPLIVSSIIVILGFIFKYNDHEKLNKNKFFIFFDTIGLVIFSYMGTILAIKHNFNFAGVIFLSLLTATGGSVIRDIMMNKDIYLFKEDFYGMIAIIIGFLIYLLHILNLPLNVLNISIILIFGFILRIFAIKYKFKLLIINLN
jgi:uncharacterized membrane protein YeiH